MSADVPPAWRQYERDVAHLLKALAPGVSVDHDVKTIDKDTGNPRQRDVWIETTLAGVIPIRVFVSCKHWDRPLHEQDMDAVAGEFLSSGANVGVVFALNGFTDGALAKAKARGINCCLAYLDQPPDLPEVLLYHAYCYSACLEFGFAKTALPGFARQRDLFDLTLREGERATRLIDIVAQHYQAGEQEVVAEAYRGLPPRPWLRTVTIAAPEGEIIFQVGGRWAVHRGRLEAHRAKGIYSVTDRRFVGGQQLPPVGLTATDPGPGWEPVDSPPEGARVVFCIRHAGDVQATLLAHWGERPVPR